METIEYLMRDINGVMEYGGETKTHKVGAERRNWWIEGRSEVFEREGRGKVGNLRGCVQFELLNFRFWR